MPQTTLTCAQVDAGEFEARYLAGRLPPADAEAYEAHYFGCDRHWNALRRATEARAAFATPRARRARWALPLAAVLTAVAVWRLVDAFPAAEPVALRGAADSLTVAVTAGPDSLRASWPRRADADAYRVRGFAADGALLWALETPDTSVAAARGGAARLDVAAFDRARSVIAQSPLVRLNSR